MFKSWKNKEYFKRGTAKGYWLFRHSRIFFLITGVHYCRWGGLAGSLWISLPADGGGRLSLVCLGLRKPAGFSGPPPPAGWATAQVWGSWAGLTKGPTALALLHDLLQPAARLGGVTRNRKAWWSSWVTSSAGESDSFLNCPECCSRPQSSCSIKAERVLPQPWPSQGPQIPG